MQFFSMKQLIVHVLQLTTPPMDGMLQSWTKLVETNAISARISQFPCMETPTRLHKWLPSPLRIPSLNVVWKD